MIIRLGTILAVVALWVTPAFAQDPPPVQSGTGNPGGTQATEPTGFTSRFTVTATPDEVPGGGNPAAIGVFQLRFDATTETVCFDIVLRGVQPPFASPAATATHIHQGAPGEAGPPVVLFPNPQPRGDGPLASSGCLQRPFVDAGFSLASIEQNPGGFYVDVHTSAFPTGEIRGQLGTPAAASIPTGLGGGAGAPRTGPFVFALSLLLVLAAGHAARVAATVR